VLVASVLQLCSYNTVKLLHRAHTHTVCMYLCVVILYTCYVIQGDDSGKDALKGAVRRWGNGSIPLSSPGGLMMAESAAAAPADAATAATTAAETAAAAAKS
jgi:hypothetical protein